MKPLTLIRYILIFASILVMFFNLFGAIIGNESISYYLLNVGLFFLISMLFVFLDSLDLIVWTIFIIATITMSLDDYTSTCSYAVAFFCIASYLKREMSFRITIYITTLISTVGVSIFKSQTPADLINVIIAYTVVYSLSELTYQEIIRRNK